MKKETNYEAAIAELEKIVGSMESGELSLDEVTTNLRLAQELLKMCKDRLTKTDEEIQKILMNDK